MQQNIIALKKDNTIIDLQTAKQKNLDGEPIYFDNSKEALEIIKIYWFSI